MVCATNERSARIAGGFVLIPAASLLGIWRACQVHPLSIGDFRAWLATHEMVARRCLANHERSPSYSTVELAKLLGVTSKRAKASVRQLETAGLIQWSDSAIGFPEGLGNPDEQVVDTIGGGEGSVAIPRRMLRFLAAGARPAIIAVALAVILRCLSRRRTGWDGRGRVKASWIAQTFKVSIPAVKAARRELLALGWIQAEDSDQWAMNRWGRPFRIDLAWAHHGSTLIPPPPPIGPTSIPPCLHQEPLPEREENQEPASGGPAGVEVKEQAGQAGQTGQEPESEPIPTNSVPAGMKPVLALPAPTLAEVRVEDLKDTGRLLELHGQAVARKLVSPSEADRLRFVAAAEHAVAIGKENPPGLFAYLVRGHCWRYLTQADEDRANARLKAHLRGPLPIVVSREPTFGLVLSEDARIVREVRAAMIRAGFYRDPWALFQSRNPDWDRARWDRALSDLGLA